LIADSKGRLARVTVNFAALAGGLAFLLVDHLRWPWLRNSSPTKHLHACSVIANKVIFDGRSGAKDCDFVAVVSILFGAMFFIVGAIGTIVWIFSAEKTAAPLEIANRET
jgi:hypothetical protein